MDFLEIKGLKKSFGQGESHIDVLKGIDMTINQGNFVYYLVLLVLVNLHYLILLGVLIV